MPEWGRRSKARERALQFLFGLDFTGCAWQHALEGFWSTAPSRPSVRKYAHALIQGVCLNREALDADIDNALQNWTPERVGRVERNILRIALFEMRHAQDVPAAVAIDEAIELAKTFGADDAARFINGVLDRLRELGG